MKPTMSRRTLLRRTAALTTGVVAASRVSAAPPKPLAKAEDAAETNAAQIEVAGDHDPATGEIFDRDRHHHWDTV